MSNSLRYNSIINTIKVNGIYVEEQRNDGERRNTPKHKNKHINRYDRRISRSRRESLQINVQV